MSDITLSWLLAPQLEAFAAAGFEVHAASAPGPGIAGLTAAGIQHHPLRHASRRFAPGEDLRLLSELRALCADLRPEIVHTHTPKPGLVGRLAARLSKVPVVIHTVHGIYAGPEDKWLKKAVVYPLDRLASEWCDAELVQNPEDLALLRRLRVPAKRLHLLGNGVDLERFRPDRLSHDRRHALRALMGAGEGDVLCGAVGRLVVEKGFRELFEVAASLQASAPNLRFAMIGPREERGGLSQADLARAEATGNITFLGRREDVDDLYAAMDMFVLPSYREGFPRSAMEAAATGLPLVVTDIRGCREVVDATNGLLVTRADVPSLQAAIRDLAADAERRHELGSASRAKAEREFDQQRVIERTLSVYRQLTDAAAVGPPVMRGRRVRKP